MADQYKSILKATTIFGGAQLLQILIGIIRSKFIAILIGATGMGISNLYTSSLAIIITLFGAGINISVVRDIAKAYEENDNYSMSEIIKIFRLILCALSILGALFVIAFSKNLSNWSFNDGSHIFDYILLSLYLVFTLLQQGNTAILVGTRRIADTAKCSLFGALATLVTSIPCFYFFHYDGIVPGLIFSTFANYLISYIYAKQINIPTISIDRIKIIAYGKMLIPLGLAMVIAQLLGNASTYIVNMAIANIGDIKDIGLYNAGLALTMQSVTLVFSAMSSDFFPRLSAVMNDKDKMSETINQQSEIVICLAVPILCFMMVLADILIRLLLSDEFLVITSFIRIICLGMLFKTITYALGLASFAKGDKRTFLFLEGIYSNIMNSLLSITLYYLWGISGLAIAFLVGYVLYYILVYAVDCKKYKYQISNSLKRMIIISVSVISLMFIISYLFTPKYYLCIGCILSIIVTIVYIKELNSKTNIITFLFNRIKKDKS